jgi:hypothetical protein
MMYLFARGLRRLQLAGARDDVTNPGQSRDPRRPAPPASHWRLCRRRRRSLRAQGPAAAASGVLWPSLSQGNRQAGSQG